MIKCKICGHEVKYRLIEHIQKTHKMDVELYKKDYGEVVSEEYKKKVSDKSKDKWKDEEYRNKTMISREWIYENEEVQEKRRNSILNFYKNGGKNWNDGLKKIDDDRLISIGEKNKKNLTGRKKEDYVYLKEKSDLMKSLWDNSNFKKISYAPKDAEYRKKISETLTNKILSGEINTFSNFKSGWYENEKGKYWYNSGLELNSMILMDNLKIDWLKNNKIKIKYIKENREHYYIPDFIINKENSEYIVEMKGFDWYGDTDLKSEYAKKEYENYRIFYNIDELKDFLDKK